MGPLGLKNSIAQQFKVVPKLRIQLSRRFYSRDCPSDIFSSPKRPRDLSQELMRSQSHNLPIPVSGLISFFILNCFDNHSYQFLTQNYGSYAVIRSDKISTLFTVISKGIDAMHSGTSVQNRKKARQVSSIVLSLNFSD